MLLALLDMLLLLFVSLFSEFNQ